MGDCKDLLIERFVDPNKGFAYRIFNSYTHNGDRFWGSRSKTCSVKKIIDLRGKVSEDNIFYSKDARKYIDADEERIEEERAGKKAILEVMLTGLYYSNVFTNREFLN